MSITESEMVLDSIVQQTWKRMRSPREIQNFLNRREALLSPFEEEFDF
jgi:hypothetical protein